MNKMDYSLILLASGSGVRSGLNYNKVLHVINGKSIIKHAADCFYFDENCKQIILVIKENELVDFQKEFSEYKDIEYVIGGNYRHVSVLNGLKCVKENYVLIHDGARPNVSKRIIDDLLLALEDYDAVIPAINLIDTIKEVNDNEVIRTLPRDSLKAVQTPQAFKTDLIKESFAKADLKKNFFDDASVVEIYSNAKVFCISGDLKNVKYTIESDFKG